MSVFHNNVLAGASGATGAAGYEIERSLRFNSAHSSYLSTTIGSALTTYTLSFWVKRSRLGTDNEYIFSSGNAGLAFQQTSDYLYIWNGSSTVYASGVYRDPSAWYHIVYSVSSNSANIYVNGVQVLTGGSAPTLSTTSGATSIGTYYGSGTRNYFFNGYLAEVNFIDGQALDADDFGETDSDNNWNPKEYSGTYGTNGFHLDFSDNSSNAALGDDSSGNNNDWTVNNLTASETKWSNYMTTTGTFLTNNGPDKAFDNSLSAADVPALDGGQTITWAPPGGLAYSSKVEIYVGGISGFTYSFNGATAVTATNNAWNVLDTGSGTINSIVFDRGINETHGPHAIRVDNVVLVDGTPSNTDSLIDTPTNADADSGNNIGNYATLNPLSKGSAITLANGNLDISAASSGSQRVWGTIGVNTGKWYFEFTQSSGTYAQAVGIKSSAAQDNSTQYAYHGNTGNKINASGSTSSYGATWGNNDVIGVAFDLDAGTITFYKNGASQGQAFSGITDATYFPYVVGWSGGTFGGVVNFGARPFAYTPPSNHLPLVTTNLPDPTIADGSTAFDAVTYSGNGTTQTITGINHSPDFVWIKCRNDSVGHQLFDQVRGAGKSLLSNTTDQERTNHIYGYLSAFTSDGFTVTAGSSDDFEVNGSSETYVAWNWDAGTSTATNTDGSITSNVRANQSAGFSIVTYEADAPNNVIGHGLNAEPYFVITKARDRTDNWLVYHYDLGVNKWLHLNLSSAVITTSGIWGTASNWTSSTFGVSTSSIEGNNYGSHDYVALCWAPVSQFSSFGSYTGNGSSDGPFVYTGFRVRFLLVKNADNTDGWSMWDAARDPDNEVVNKIEPNSSGAEGTNAVHKYDFLSNGFKVRGNWNGFNGSGNTIVYAAFAEHPFALNGGLAR